MSHQPQVGMARRAVACMRRIGSQSGTVDVLPSAGQCTPNAEPLASLTRPSTSALFSSAHNTLVRTEFRPMSKRGSSPRIRKERYPLHAQGLACSFRCLTDGTATNIRIVLPSPTTHRRRGISARGHWLWKSTIRLDPSMWKRPICRHRATLRKQVPRVLILRWSTHVAV